MEPDMIREIEADIERLARRYAAYLREGAEARPAAARWAVEASALCWFILLEDVAEPDIDVEIAREVLIVRASRIWPDPAILVSLLPVPRGFDLEHPVIRYSEGTLEVRIGRVRRGPGR